MSVGQPPNLPPPPAGYPPSPPAGIVSQPPYGTYPQPQQRRGFFDIRGLPLWEKVLVLAPLSLIGVGGLIGGICGALASTANNYVARSGLAPAVRALVMIGMLIAAYFLYFVIALVVYAAIRSAAA